MLEEILWKENFDRNDIEVEHLFTNQNFLDRYYSFQWSALWMSHTLMQSALFRPEHRSKKVKGLYYTGSYTNPGIGMPMCLISWKLVCDAVEEDA